MSDPRSAARMSPAVRADVERWFARRGVPQLIEGYSSEPAMDRRAAPLISLWLLVGTVRDWGTRPDWPVEWNALGVLATLAWMGVVWFGVSRLRGRSPTDRPATFDVLDIATMALLPAVPAAVIDANPGEAIAATLGALTGIGVIYLVVGFGLVEIVPWAFTRLWSQVTHLVELIARALPLLLILVVFLLFGAEIWQVAHGLTALELVLVLVLLLAVATLLVLTSVRRELRRLEAATASAAPVAFDDLAGTPAEGLAGAVDPRAVPPRTSLLQRANLTLLVAVPQLLQAIAVGAVVMAFLVVFAVIAIPGSVQEGWIGAPPRILGISSFLDETRTLTAELVAVAAVLGGIVGLYFSGLAVTDPTYRAEGFDRELAGVRQILAVRRVYLAALGPPARPGDATT
jgi:hypothetical protein